MGSKGSQTVTQSGNQTQTYTPNQPIKAAGEQAVTGAQAAAQLPFQMPVAPVAPFTPFQNQAFNSIQNLQGFAQPYFNTAGAYLAGSAAPVTGSEVANFYNPMAANVTAQMQNIFGQQNVQNTGNLVNAAGGVGADRVAVGQANMANQQGLAAGQTYAGLYQQALQAAEQNKQMQAGAGYAFGQMGPAAQAAQMNAVNQLLGAGGQQQQLAQAQANAAYQQQLAQIAFPYQQPQYLAGITAGLAPALGGTTQGQYTNQTTYPSPSPLAQGLGLATAGLGLFGGMGGFGALGGGLGGMFGGLSPMQQYGSGAPMQFAQYGNGNFYPMFGNRGGRVGYDDGGAVDDNYGKLADRGYYEAEAPMLAAAGKGNPLAATVEKDVGSLYNFDDGGATPYQIGKDPPLFPIDPNKDNLVSGAIKIMAEPPAEVIKSGYDRAKKALGYDDGGGIADPMQLNMSPTSGFDAPGANPKVPAGGVIPKMQLPSGQSGRYGPGGVGFMMPMGQGTPRLPQQSQNPMGGVGQLGSMLGKDIGQLGNLLGGSGAGAGAGAAGAADAGASAADAVDLVALGLANRGGRMAEGGNIDDSPTIGPGNVPMAPRKIPLPKQRPDVPIEYYPKGPYVHNFNPSPEWRQGQVQIGSGGAVGRPNRHWDYLQPMQPQAFDDGGDVDFLPPTGAAVPALKPLDWLPPSIPISEAPPGSVPEMGLGERATAKDQSRLPSTPGIVVSPAEPPPHRDNIAPMGGDNIAPMGDNVPMPRPNPLGGLTPEMREKFPALRSAAADRGVNFDIGEGYRSQERQNQLYAQGRTAPGPVVTDAPYSYHTSGNAIDVVPVEGTTEGQVGTTVADLTRNDPRFTNMRSGSTFRGLYDPLHVELHGNQEARTPGGAPINAGPMGSQPGTPYGQMVAGTPYPDALKRDWGQNMVRSPWMALVNAGARMAQTHGPIGSVIGAGLGAAGQTLEGQRQELRGEEAINLKADQLHQLAQQHLLQYGRMTAYQEAEVANQKRRTDLMEARLKEMTPQQHAQAEIAIRKLHPEFDSLSPDQQTEIRLGIYAHPELISGGQPGSSKDNPAPDPGAANRVKGQWYLDNGTPRQWT